MYNVKGAEDIEAIKAVADQMRPLVPVVVDAVYTKLFTFDITKKHFLPKNEGFDGPTTGHNQVATSLEDLTLDNPQTKVTLANGAQRWPLTCTNLQFLPLVPKGLPNKVS